MKDKILTLKAKGVTPKQWSTLILELNIMKNEWKPYGVDIQLSAPSIKKIIALGTNAVKDKREWSNGRAGALDDDISVKRRSINKNTSRIY